MGCQDTSDPRHFGTSAELSGHIHTSAEVSYGHFGAKKDTKAPGNTGPSHGKVDGCACIIM